MTKELPNKIQLTVSGTRDNFVKVIKDNLSKSEIVFFPTRYLFGGTIDQSHFRLYRLKQSNLFDFNVTELEGKINDEGQRVTLDIDFSLVWIFKYALIAMIVIFGLLDILILTLNDSDKWEALGIFLFVEILAIGQLVITNKVKFKTDKEKYIKMLTSLFDIVVTKNAR